MSDTNTVETNPLKSLEDKAKTARKGNKAGDGSVTVRPARKTSAKAASKSEPKPGKGIKFEAAFTRTFTDWLLPHGFRQVESEPGTVIFAKNGTRIEIKNPSLPGGSKFADWVVIRKGSQKRPAGKGRDALAEELKIAKFVR
jgi:hypothetical protein